VTLYVIGCLLTGGLTTRDFVGVFDPGKVICAALTSVSACRKPPDPTHKSQKYRNRANWKFLRHLIWCTAALPGVASSTQAFNMQRTTSRTNISTVRDTSMLKGMNLQILLDKIQSSQQLSSLPGTASIPLLLDCEASAITSPSLEDFEPESLCDLPKPIKMRGIGGDVEIHQAGVLRYSTLDDSSNPMILQTPGFYMPDLNQRLFSPQVFFHTGGKGGELAIQANRSILRMRDGQTLMMPLDPTLCSCLRRRRTIACRCTCQHSERDI
jgi:hypothetical protein